MSKKQQIYYAERMIEGKDVSKDRIDIEALIDSELTWSENKKTIQEKIDLLSEEQEEKSQKQIEDEQEKYDKQAEKHKQEYENNKMESLIEQHHPEDSSNTGIYYENMYRYIDMVAEGYRNFLILKSRAGLGKSFQTVHRLHDNNLEKGEDFEVKKGFTSPLELYKELYHHRDKVVVLDDLEGILSNPRAVSILKAVTSEQEKGESGMVEWKSNTDQLEDVPNSFEFQGQIIMCVNNLPEADRFKPVASRSIIYELDFKHEEVADLLIEVAKEINHELNKDKKVDTAKWIAGNSSEDCNLDLRNLRKVLDMRAFSEDEWKEMARPELNLDEEIGFIKRHYKLGKDKKHIQELYIDKFEKSGRTFRRKWEKAGLQ